MPPARQGTASRKNCRAPVFQLVKLKLVAVLEIFPSVVHVRKLVVACTAYATLVKPVHWRVQAGGSEAMASTGWGTLKTVHWSRTTLYSGMVTGLVAFAVWMT